MTSFKNVVLTGDRPTGRLHLGHYVGSIQNRLSLQDTYADCLYMVADVQALTDNADNPEKVRSNVLEVILDNLACGIDPNKTICFVQSCVPEIAELTVFFMNLVTLARLRRNPTVKDEMLQKGFGENVPVGFLAYPVSQAADILFCKGNIVPVGEDQYPVIEQANEIAAKFNALYGEVFPKIKAQISTTPRLIGIDGNAKASKSLGNAIYLSDSKEEIERKVMMMYTDPGHTSIDLPGKVEGNVVFTYLDTFDPNTEEVAELKKQYQSGGLGDVILKKRLSTTLNSLISPIRARREHLAQNQAEVMRILEEGNRKARAIAEDTMKEVRKAMKIDYF